MKKVLLKIEGMTCSACSASIEKYLNKQPGVFSANVNLVLAQASIEYDDSLSIDDLNRFIKECGYKSLGIYEENEEKKQTKDKRNLLLFGILLVLDLYIAMGHMLSLPTLPLLNPGQYPIIYSLTLFFLACLFLIYGQDIFRVGFKNLLHKSPNMDTLVMVGVSASFLYSIFSMIMILKGNQGYTEQLYFESCATIIYFIKLGRYIDNKSKEKTKEAIKELVQITPKTATLKTKGKERQVTIDEIKEGDILVTRPGEKIAVDGVITKGSTHVDESFLTGEALPIKKGKDEKVIAGSMNYDGYIEYEAKKIGRNSTISEIVHLVLDAVNTKAPIARLADKVSGYFVPLILLLSILTFVFYLIFKFPIQEAVLSFVSVLVVACPCSLGLATPLAIVISEGVCARKGIFVKTSTTLENAYKMDTIIFDKTGTLTYGKLKIAKIYNYSPYKEQELLKKVASIEFYSTHPISKAFVSEKNKIKKLKVEHYKNLPGIGVYGEIDYKKIYIGNAKIFQKLKIKNEHEIDEVALQQEGNSVVYIIEDKKVLGLIGVSDIVREKAKTTIQELKDLKKEVIMLTGDNETTAKQVATSLGIDQVVANVLPKEKAAVLDRLLSQGKQVMMVGDGVNDAPSLAKATIGVSIKSGTDIAADSSDVILMDDGIEKIPELIRISKKTIRNIKQNLFWAFFYNLLMIPIAMGFLKPIHIRINPMFASLAMTCSSLTVVFNALRLKNKEEKICFIKRKEK